MTESPHLSYWSVRTNSWTFNNTKIRAWVEAKLRGRTLNACCGLCQLDHDAEIIRNDLQEEITLEKDRTINGVKYEEGDVVSTETDVNMHVADLLNEFDENSFETIVYDPPFSENQAEQTYDLNGTHTESDSSIPETLDKLLKPGGVILTFGFSAAVMPDTYDYDVLDLALWNLFGGQYDWLSTEIQKPEQSSLQTAESSADDTVFMACDDVIPNADGNHLDDVTGTTDGNDGNSIRVTYKRFAEGTDLREKAYELIDKDASRDTLALSHHNAESAFRTPIVKNSLTPRVDGDTHYSPQRISDEFADGELDTAIIDPSVEAFQNKTRYYGGKRVVASILKYEVHPLLKPGGKVIQLANMATCMNGKLPYIRDSITILSAADTPLDYIVTIDEKQPECTAPPFGDMGNHKRIRENHNWIPSEAGTSCPICDSTTISYDTCLNCGADVGSRHVCQDCGEGSYHHPAYYVDCLTCGARPDNYCVDPDSGEVLHEPHQDRIEYSTANQATCTTNQSEETVREPPVGNDIIDTTDNNREQALLETF